MRACLARRSYEIIYRARLRVEQPAATGVWPRAGPRRDQCGALGSRAGDPRDRHLALALHGGGDRVHDGEGRVVLNLGKHAVAAVGLVQVRVGAEVDEELRVPTVGHVPMSNRRGATGVRHPWPDCRTDAFAWVGEGAGGWVGELCGFSPLVSLTLRFSGAFRPVPCKPHWMTKSLR